ncbi:MAG: acyloxyacyl hydrolase [Paraburkholderia sp.]|uniref:acyloxyacyl hydrolase n=1 Tax=Paraburkholderia sp. TaxID=1926495 RepID=UPI00122A0025|nr:acyloxyacyl hydrolase [Paraburkholderia sp.]TAM01839.1 MAG: acyloxyacyl hydrolase [Paraburkholderia sp.]
MKDALVLITAFCALSLASADAAADTFGIQVAEGVADHDVRKTDFGVAWDPGLQWWQIGAWHFTVIPEVHVAYWNVRESHSVNPAIWEFGATPVFRFVRSTGWIRPYVEAGVGIRLLSHVRETDDRTFSSSFQFADMVGAGAQFGAHQNYLFGVRFQHVSNAGIKHPNPGANFSQVYFQYNF